MDLGRAGTVSLVAIGVVCVLGTLVLLAPALVIGLLLALPQGSSDGLRDEIGDQARDLAHALRNERVRTAIDRGERAARIAGATGTQAVRADLLQDVVAGFTAVPLLRSPCSGTTGYCPGG